MTVYRVRLDGPGDGIIAEVGDKNRWCVIRATPGYSEQCLMDILPMAAQVGEKAPRLPDSTRYPNGAIRVCGGEILTVTPRFESKPGQVY